MRACIKGAYRRGAIKIELPKPLRDVIACHCGQSCKLACHYGAATAMPTERLVFHSNARLQWYQSSQHIQRGFRNICGSNLFYDHEQRPEIAISPGALEDQDELSLTAHIFKASKGAYDEICDQLPQHKQWSGRWSD